jgi:predicted ATPase/DNA-binding SARP family transcriptional activator/Tfp pilus assembly protein PilF
MPLSIHKHHHLFISASIRDSTAESKGKTSAMWTLHIQLLGVFRLVYGEEPVTSLRSSRLQSLLAYLLLHRDAPQPRSHVAFVFWPDATEAQAHNSLRNLLYRLRRELPDADRFLHIDGQTLHWHPQAPFKMDVAEFEEAASAVVTAKADGNRAMVHEALEKAVSLYQDDLLPSCYDDWILPERERLRATYIQLLDTLIRLLENQQDYVTAIRYAERLLQHDPLREASYRRLMRLHARRGDRAAALHVYQRCVETLAEELGVEPAPRTETVYTQLFEADTAVAHPRNLPFSPTPLIGREEELAEIARLLADPACRLLTLVGPGGIGKTRLAVRAARQAPPFPHGIHFVPLASVSSVALLDTAIADALQLPYHSREEPETQLLNYLRQKEILLVLDNLEHLLPGAALIAGILQAAPRVKLLVTSRERLNIQGEWLIPIAGLRLPVEENKDPAEASSAVQLFLQSARRVRPDFTLSDAEREPVVKICQLVEGMPLGIELAAAWMRALSGREIAGEIEKGLDFLATWQRDLPERHRSLRAAFEHSWNLLSESEKVIFRQLSVFQGGFRRPAAAQVAGASLPNLLALLDKSLLHRTATGRYQMHQLLRQFGAEKLREVPQEQTLVLNRHCEYYTAFLQAREADLKKGRQQEGLAEIREEIDNVRAAWSWAVAHAKLEQIEASLGNLYHFHEIHGWFHEGEVTFGEAAASLAHHSEPTAEAVLAKVIARQGAFCYRRGRYKEVRQLLQRSLAISRRLGLRSEIAFCLQKLGATASRQGEYKEARQLLHQALALYQEMGDKWGAAACLTPLGDIARNLGEYVEAHRLLQESLALCRQVGDSLKTAAVLNNLGILAGAQGEYAEARQLFERSLAIRRAFGYRWGAASNLGNLGVVARALGEHTTAKQFLQESLTLRKDIGSPYGIAISLNNLGLVAYDLQEYDEARQFFRESLAIRREIDDRRGIASSLNKLGRVNSALGNNEIAQRRFYEALQTALEIQNTPQILDILAGIAELLQLQGEKARAAEYLALVLDHPASERQTQTEASQHLDRLAAELPAELLRTVQEKGKSRTLADVAHEILGR